MNKKPLSKKTAESLHEALANRRKIKPTHFWENEPMPSRANLNGPPGSTDPGKRSDRKSQRKCRMKLRMLRGRGRV